MAIADGTKHVGAQNQAIIHRDRRVPIDAHSIAGFGLHLA
jgi:hypothetical protein